ncbi:hypothetical protein [Alteromonas oceanisediminis]|uniref:hypothetical protein n=1 Tax=Alteromonas oceanisediminis TaxID=2836180 RepID=UPI001BDB1282|nr:hypothetical protein [Alteromonas oceanisediminis]MBT0586632.1 hypothetical protein [Alteromonas oceanisediminis]
MTERDQLQTWVGRVRAQYVRQELTRFGAVLLLCAAILLVVVVSTQLAGVTTGSILAPSAWVFWAIVVTVGFTWLLGRNLVRRVQHITAENLLLHLNRNLPELEESAQLFLASDETLSALQKRQKRHVTAYLKANAAEVSVALSMVYPQRRVFWHLMISVFIVVSLLAMIEHLRGEPQLPQDASNMVVEEQPQSLQPPQFHLSIQPPTYTGLPARTSESLDVEVAQGAQVTWYMQTSQPNVYALNVHSGSQYAFAHTVHDTAHVGEFQDTPLRVTLHVQTPLLYTIQREKNAEWQAITDIHTINVIRDRAPFIDVVSPESTVTEFAKNAVPALMTKVFIDDDYGISDVYILASIAKGTGEAVKFRDETFRFDTQQPAPVQQVSTTQSATAVHRLYQKQWDLIALGMEPGDELYFSVVAVDNREPEPQQVRSQTKIIKWLDDDVVGVNADGVLMDFIPDYFKSQRQIIIETTALIEAQERLSQAEFEQTSRELALAQADLKQRYGQYLGDEFESGVMQTMEAGPLVPKLAQDPHDDHSHADEHEHDHASEQAHQHASGHAHNHGDHQASERAGTANALSGYDDIIERFGHNHGEADIGFISLEKGQFSPKLLMKQSIAQMWQAELFLHLAEPHQALPYEQRALDLLNRARKADRVYVKRLGFEPPPVSEERRYQGELDDITAPDRTKQVNVGVTTDATLRAALASAMQQPRQSRIEADQLVKLEALVAVLSEEIASDVSDPETLHVTAIVQRFLQHERWNAPGCDRCIERLQNYLLSRLTAPVAKPVPASFDVTSSVVDDFIRRLQHDQVNQPLPREQN